MIVQGCAISFGTQVFFKNSASVHDHFNLITSSELTLKLLYFQFPMNSIVPALSLLFHFIMSIKLARRRWNSAKEVTAQKIMLKFEATITTDTSGEPTINQTSYFRSTKNISVSRSNSTTESTLSFPHIVKKSSISFLAILVRIF